MANLVRSGYLPYRALRPHRGGQRISWRQEL